MVVSGLKTNHYHTFDRAEFDHMIGYTLYLDSARCAVYVRQELKKHTKHITVGDEKQTEDARFPEDVFYCCAVSIADASTQQKLLVVSCYRSPSAVSGNTTDVFEKVAQVPGDTRTQLSPGTLTSTTSAWALKRRTRRVSGSS